MGVTSVQPSRISNQTIRTLKVRQGDKRSLQQLPGTEVSLQDTEDGIASQQPPALEQTPPPTVALKLKLVIYPIIFYFLQK